MEQQLKNVAAFPPSHIQEIPKKVSVNQLTCFPPSFNCWFHRLLIKLHRAPRSSWATHVVVLNPITASLAQLSVAVSVCKWFSPELCKTHSYVLLLCCWGETQPCTQAAIPASELPNIQPYKLSFNSLICPCPAVRVSAWPVLEEEMDRKHSFSDIIPIFFTTQLRCHDRSRQHRKQTLPVGFGSQGITALKQML